MCLQQYMQGKEKREADREDGGSFFYIGKYFYVDITGKICYTFLKWGKKNSNGRVSEIALMEKERQKDEFKECICAVF